jgi:hypothetical protein
VVTAPSRIAATRPAAWGCGVFRPGADAPPAGGARLGRTAEAGRSGLAAGPSGVGSRSDPVGACLPRTGRRAGIGRSRPGGPECAAATRGCVAPGRAWQRRWPALPGGAAAHPVADCLYTCQRSTGPRVKRDKHVSAAPLPAARPRRPGPRGQVDDDLVFVACCLRQGLCGRAAPPRRGVGSCAPAAVATSVDFMVLCSATNLCLAPTRHPRVVEHVRLRLGRRARPLVLRGAVCVAARHPWLRCLQTGFSTGASLRSAGSQRRTRARPSTWSGRERRT